MKADLHMHTTASDGRLSNQDLFKRASLKDVDIIAITDHDVCRKEAVEENKRLADAHGLRYIPGIELSTLYQGKNVHVLGYFKTDGYAKNALEDYYDMIRIGREQRAKQFIENLKRHFDIEIDYENLLELSNGVIARPHIAKAIQNSYPEYSHNYIFDTFIGDHTKAYVPSTELPLKEGIDLLKAHGALVVLAHPVLLKPHIHDAVLAHDFDGIEAIYSQNDESDTHFYKAYAKTHNLLITAGSDFHGIVNDKSHGDIGDVTLEGDALDAFLKALDAR